MPWSIVPRPCELMPIEKDTPSGGLVEDYRDDIFATRKEAFSRWDSFAVVDARAPSSDISSDRACFRQKPLRLIC